RAETEKAPEDEPVVAEASPAAPAPSPPNLSEETSPAAPEIAGATSPEPSTGETGTDGDTVAVASPVPSAIPEEEQAEEDTADLADQAAEEEAAPAGDTRSNTALAADDPAESSSAPERLAAVDTEPAEGSVDEAESNESAEASAPQLLLADEDGITVLQSPEAMSNVALDTISYDEQGDVSLGGRALGTGFVRVYLDDRPITTSRIEANGTWRTSLPNVASGVYTLRVDEVGEDGEVTSRIETPFRREDPEVVAELSASTPETTDDVAAPLQQDVFTVQPGSTLWAIARANYGEGQLYVKVFEANRDRIRDPDLIYPGQVFDIPE
ncbi:MAG: LysM peptidoglycan-binding domain-containing protein, partial [Pseudomonadota bacterium]